MELGDLSLGSVSLSEDDVPDFFSNLLRSLSGSDIGSQGQ
jgi:hypothetical protein